MTIPEPPEAEDHRSRGWGLARVGLIVAAIIAMQETDRLIGQVLGADGTTSSVPWSFLPTGPSHDEVWSVWASVSDASTLNLLLLMHVLFGLAFTVIVLDTVLQLPRAGRSVSSPVRIDAAVRFLASAVGVFKGLEAVLITISVVFGDWEAVGILRFTVVTWGGRVAMLAFIIAVLAQWEAPKRIGSFINRWTRALWHQRLSLMVVGITAALGLVPGSDISDQFPDAIRGWIGSGGRGWLHFLMAVIAIVIAWICLLVLGRLRSERDFVKYFHTSVSTPWRPPSPLYLAVPLLIIVVGSLLQLVGRARELHTLGMLITTATLLALWAISWFIFDRQGGKETLSVLHLARTRWVVLTIIVLGSIYLAAESGFFLILLGIVFVAGLLVPPIRRKPTATAETEPPGASVAVPQDTQRAQDTRRVGDLLAESLLVVSGLAMVRAFVAPLLLGPRGDTSWFSWVLQLALVVSGLTVAALGPGISKKFASSRPGRTFLPDPAPSESGEDPTADGIGTYGAGKRYRPDLLVLIFAACWLAAVTLLPVAVVRVFGGIALVVLVLAAWAYVIGFVIVRLQRQQPLDVFRIIGARAAPIMTLICVVLFVNSLNGGDPMLHTVRALDGPPPNPSGQKTLNEAFKAWTKTGSGCHHSFSVDSDGTETEIKARPMILIAAAGGGIRAAYWTAYTMSEFDEPCERSATFLSSGVSGGSVGLTVSQSSPAQTKVAIDTMAEPEALGSAAAGLFVSDLLAVGTGVRAPSWVDGEWAWRDRSGLMEAAWLESLGKEPELTDSVLDDPWSMTVAGPGGYLVMNSAAAGSGCRVLISQVDLSVGTDRAEPGEPEPGEPAGSAIPRCRAFTGLPPASADLIDRYGSCTPAMDWLAASMLSARFPLVTPAARIPGPTSNPDDNRCSEAGDLQLIDGGYAEGSGLGTLVDIAPQIMKLVRDHNDLASQGKAESYIVPVVLFIENHSGADIAAPAPPLAVELFVPLAGLVAGDLQTSPSTWLQRVSEAIDGACPLRDETCKSAVDHVERELNPSTTVVTSGRVVVVAPSTEPAVAAPLGWTLSRDSRQRLQSALAEQASGCPDIRPGGQYPCLHELLGVLDNSGA